MVALVIIPFELALTAGLRTPGDSHGWPAEECRRLADMAITAEEHTDLKLGDLSTQPDHLREQNESPHRTLKEAE